MVKEYLELKIEGIHPQEMRAGELGQILTSLEDLIVEVVKVTNPLVSKDVLGVGLFKLENNSIDIITTSRAPDLASPAYHILTKVVASSNFLELPNKALDPFREIHRITSSYEKDVHFLIRNGKVTQSAILKHDTTIPKHEKIKANTTIFGKVIRVGGSQPRVVIERPSGEKVYCTVQSEKKARELGSRLYEWVGVIGRATINPDDLTVESVHVDQITEYTGKLNITETINEIREAAGDYYSSIIDVDKYINDLRG